VEERGFSPAYKCNEIPGFSPGVLNRTIADIPKKPATAKALLDSIKIAAAAGYSGK